MGYYFNNDNAEANRQQALEEEMYAQMTEREEREEKRERWIMTENLLNFCAIVVGVVLIIVLVALLFSMVDWLKRDISANFQVLIARFT